jgi:outer membrane protein OmpA-like peptidoglycan-associated protein/tetratricopeptide (TPR) repeat protein
MTLNRLFLAFSFVSICIVGLQAQTDSLKTDSVAPAPVTIDQPVTAPADSLSPAANVTSPGDSLQPVLEASAAPVAKPASATSQAKALKRANELYNKKAYAEAIPYYEKARLGDNTNKLILSNLGDCYRLTNNTTGKMHAYGELVRAGKAEPIHELYYGQALHELGEDEKAKPFLEKYTADNRGQNIVLAMSKAKAYTKNADAYTVNFWHFNSPQNDLCAVKFYDAIVFTSARVKTPWIKREQGWTNGNYMHLYASEKDAEVAGIPPKLFMGDLNSKMNDGPASFTKDYNTVYFTRNNIRKEEQASDGSFKLKIMEASLDQNGFSGIKIMPFNNKDYNVAHPSISPDGYTLYFASDMPGGKGGMDIYMSKKDSAGVFGAPVNLGDKVNSAGNEVFPFISHDGKLYFSSDGHDGLGGLDIFEGIRSGDDVKKIYNMGEPVNSKSDDFGYYLIEDNKAGFLTSNRKNGGMDDDIYELQVLRDVRRGKDATIKIRDKSTGDSIPGAKLVINGDTMLADDKGVYVLSVEEELDYKIEALKEDYFKAEDNISGKSAPEDAFTREITLEKDPKLFLRGLITDAKSGELLEGATIKLTDIATNSEVDVYTTTASGDYFKFLFGNRIGDKLTYLIRIEKPGYLQRTVVFTHEIAKPGEINLNEMLNLTLGKVEVGMDLAKMIDMKPIYFDLGKTTIRKDAAAELDKVVQVMNEYPNMFIELGSHTDCRSSAASNLKLSGGRAKAAAQYIIKKGINKMRITYKGYGESKLLNNCACEGAMQSTCPEEEHDKNRRVEFLITKLK